MIRSQRKLGEILVKKGLISDDKLKEALNEQARTKEFLGAILIKKRQIKEHDLLSVLSEQFGMPVVSLQNKYIDWDVARSFSASLILDYKCMPFQRNDSSVTIAITNPLDAWVLKKAEEEARGLEIKFVLVSQEDINEALSRYQKYMRWGISKWFR